MLSYFLRLAWAALQKSKGMSVLMVLTIGLGIAATMTATSLYRGVSADPIPDRSSKLYVPQIDVWGPANKVGAGEPPGGVTYLDAKALLAAHKARFQSAMYSIEPTITVADGRVKPFHAKGYAVSTEFFPMIEVPLVRGRSWTAAEQADMASVAVVSQSMVRRLFGTDDALGRSFIINEEPIRIIGITPDWNPQPRFFDVFGSGGFAASPIDVMMPYTTVGGLALDPVGNMSCTPTAKREADSCVFMSYLVYLETASDVKSFRSYLDAYASDARISGRFDWPPNNRLRSLPAWLDHTHVVPADTKISIAVAFGLLAVCLASVVGLLVVSFDRRSREVGIRRALGATRAEIAGQFFIESALIGLIGGVAASFLTLVGVALLRASLPDAVGRMVQLDPIMFLVTLFMSVLAAFLAGIYPSLKVANPRLATMLKDS